MIVGVNHCPDEPTVGGLRWAESDANELFQVLTDPVSGTFDASDTALITGTDAVTDTIKRALRTAALMTDEGDLLLVYFSGHGFIPSWTTEPYLATHDLDSSQLYYNPDEAIRTGFLQRDVFSVARGNTILILDCCHAGAFPSDHEPTDTVVPYFYSASPRTTRGHSALLSCPSEAASRESDVLRHGNFTYHLLEGLRGKASAVNQNVTLDSLGGFLRGVGIEPPFGQHLQAFGEPLVLTRPAPSAKSTASESLIPLGHLQHPLEKAEPLIWPLLDSLFARHSPAPNASAEDLILERMTILRGALDADGVAIGESNGRTLRAANWDDQTPDHRLTRLVQELPSTLLSETALGHQFGYGEDSSVLAIRLTANSAVVISNPSPAALAAGEPLAIIIRKYLESTSTTATAQSMVELDTLTTLLKQFGRLPHELAERAFRLYREMIDDIVMVFEPVIRLSRDVGIFSYEALARGSETETSAPGELLDLATTWGPRFLVERDTILARKAISTYAQAHRRGPWRDDLAKPLSVNVSVNAISSSKYIESLRDALNEAHWPADQTTLEISEKDPIEAPAGDVWLPNPQQWFHDRITRLANEMGIRFAVDDFGVGYASLDRLASLPITQIKVDSAVLKHPLAIDELELVVRVANHSLSAGRAAASRPIILEGVEEDSPVPLAEIHDAGITFIQGYIAGDMASTELRPLTSQVRDLIVSRLEGASRA